MVGRTIFHYKILEELGRGGMGVVYKALDLRLNRFVALKFLPPELTRDQDAIDRFIHEAQAASALDHANICTIHEINETEDEQLFICMAYYPGETLEKKVASSKALSGGQLSVDSVINIVTQVAQGLGRAHEAGIAHRDIKPSNLIITPRGEVKIIDFGLVKLAEPSWLTKDGRASGTVAYMSPEQVQGKPVDQRTDIWSLGVVFYEMLTGRLPFHGESEQVVMYAIVHEDACPIPMASGGNGVHMALDQIVHTAMAKNPDERYQHVDEMIPALRSLKYKLESGGMGAARAAIAVLPFADLSPQKDQEYFCDGMAEELIATLAKIEGWRVVSKTSAFACKGKEQDLRRIGELLNVNYVLEGSVRKAGDTLRIATQLTDVAGGFPLWSEIYDRQLHDVFAIQDDIANAIVNKLGPAGGKPGPRPVARYTQNPAVYNLYLQGRFHLNKRTEAGLHKGVAYCGQAIALEPEYAPAYAGLADGLALLGFQGFVPPKETIPRAKAAAEEALAIDESLAEAHTSLGCIRAIFDWNWAESAKEFERALALNPNSAMAHYWYAVWYLLLTGQFDLCSAEIKKAQELDPLSLVLRAGIGWQLYFARQFERAAQALERALEMDEYYIFARDQLGQVYAQQGRYEQAIAELEHAVALSRGCALSLRALGHAYGLAGKRAEAQRVLDELLARGRRSYVSSYDIALVHAGMGEKDQALAWLEKAYEERNGWLGFLNVEPRLDSLREEARFTALLSKVGLQKHL